MFDVLEELADLSLALQKASVTLPVANRLIARQVEVFISQLVSTLIQIITMRHVRL